jgi:hypothetical protein
MCDFICPICGSSVCRYCDPFCPEDFGAGGYKCECRTCNKCGSARIESHTRNVGKRVELYYEAVGMNGESDTHRGIRQKCEICEHYEYDPSIKGTWWKCAEPSNPPHERYEHHHNECPCFIPVLPDPDEVKLLEKVKGKTYNGKDDVTLWRFPKEYASKVREKAMAIRRAYKSGKANTESI